MDLIANERTKLTANWLNAMASGLITTGIVAPGIAVAFGVVPGVGVLTVVASSVIWLLLAAALHAYARVLLGRLTS
jgi:hypothetical protein